MVTTDRFVFLHLHKSGGTFVNECLLRFVPDARHVGYHLPRSMIPAPVANLPVLGTVRNPWSYYVSWYSFQRQQPQPNFLFRTLSGEGTLGFADTVRNMLDLGSGSIRLDLLLNALPADYGNQGLNLPGFALVPIRNSGLGFYSFLCRYMYGGGTAPVRFAKMERLRSELPSMLESVGQPVSAAMRDFIEHEAPRNVSAHESYVHYYDNELRDLVAERDATTIERHGYRFED
jgi:hypothetical protein